MRIDGKRQRLLATSILAGFMASAPLLAQTAPPASPPPADTATTPPAADAAPAIVVTGTLFRRADRDTPSPVTSLSSVDLQRRGITTITDALQSIPANSGSNLPTAFSANGAFAAGASAVSLRGLTTDSTLVLFDGLRAADYPLADDGVRSFVDLNTIPEAIVDHLDIQQDGASSTYGADAVAGVVNVIIKKQITGISGTVEGGISQKSDAGHQRASLTAGYGDLKSQGFNIYVSGEYQNDAELDNRDRGYPYNTNDLSRTLADDGKTPDANTNAGGDGLIPQQNTSSAVVRPATESDPGNIYSGTAVAGGLYQVLNPAGCAPGLISHTDDSGSYCEQNNAGQYGVIQPHQQRIGVTSRGTVQVNDDIQAYLMGTYYQNLVSFGGEPQGTRASEPTPTGRRIVLPATLADGSLNPQDPYAASGQDALLNYQFGDIPSSERIKTQSYRIAGGVSGSFGSGWNFDVEGTYMHSKTDITYRGLINFDALTSAIENGTYNFVDPSQNSQAERDALSPNLNAHASSTLWQVQGTLSRELFDLPGGPLKAAVGGQVRYESIDDPVQDPTDTTNPDTPYTTLDVNLFTAVGHRYNEAGFFELDAPILKQLDVNVSGRYDHYSEGFSHFSPKVGVKVKPIEMLTLRGTFSKGFRAPSIPETQGQVIGFVNATPPAAIADAHGNDAYVQQYSLGEFNTGNPNLKPETSTSFTAGAILEPVRGLRLSADYYHIKKKNVIVEGPDDSTAIAMYYATGNLNPLPGYSITTNPADPQAPGQRPTVDIVSASFVNAASETTDGLDLAASYEKRLSSRVRFSTSLDATRVFKLNLTTDQGTQHFAGTEGPYANTSDSGTPKWRGNWSNTLEVGKVSLTGTAYYTSGYKGYAADYPGYDIASNPGCAFPIGTASDGVTAERCHVKHFIDVDFTGQLHVNDKFTFFANLINAFNTKAPFDPNTYGGTNYNPAFAQAGIVGRFFKVGANFKF